MREPFVHATAVVDAGAMLGPGVRVWHFVHVSAGARVGAGSVLGQNVYIGPGVTVGAGVKIQNNVSLYSGVEVEDDVFLGPSCVFTNVRHPRAHVERKEEFAPTRLGRGATVGANATLVCGNDLGPYAFVGAGSVVTRAVQAHALVAGNPARRMAWACRCGEKLPEPAGAPASASARETTCARCGERYHVSADVCAPIGAP